MQWIIICNFKKILEINVKEKEKFIKSKTT